MIMMVVDMMMMNGVVVMVEAIQEAVLFTSEN